MKQNYLTFLLLIIFGCTSTPKQETGDTEISSTSTEIKPASKEKPLQTGPETEASQKLEVMDLDSVWLNDAIKFATTQNEVREKLGEPDSVTTPNFECGGYVAGEEPWGDIVNIWHYQGSQIVTFKDKANLMIVRLRDWDCTLHHPRIILSGFTSTAELAEVFPNSVEQAYEWKNPTDGRTYTIVQIEPKPISDDKWMFKFFNNKLYEIEYWIGC